MRRTRSFPVARSGGSAQNYRVIAGDTPVPPELVQAIKERSALLFVGAGPSISIGLPSWRRLIDHLANELSLNATDLADAPASHYSLAEYYRIVEGSTGPLRSWMDRTWKVSEEQVRSSR